MGLQVYEGYVQNLMESKKIVVLPEKANSFKKSAKAERSNTWLFC